MKFIAAVDKNWAIGNKGKLLVRIKEDQRFFKETTMGHVVVLGRKTLEEFPGGKPLKGRTNIILSRNTGYEVEDALVVHSIDELMEVLNSYQEDDIYIIGGQSVYEALIPYCNEGIITKIDKVYDADAYIANLDKDESWYVANEKEKTEQCDVNYTFVTYKKRL